MNSEERKVRFASLGAVDKRRFIRKQLSGAFAWLAVSLAGFWLLFQIIFPHPSTPTPSPQPPMTVNPSVTPNPPTKREFTEDQAADIVEDAINTGKMTLTYEAESAGYQISQKRVIPGLAERDLAPNEIPRTLWDYSYADGNFLKYKNLRPNIHRSCDYPGLMSNTVPEPEGRLLTVSVIWYYIDPGKQIVVSLYCVDSSTGRIYFNPSGVTRQFTVIHTESSPSLQGLYVHKWPSDGLPKYIADALSKPDLVPSGPGMKVELTLGISGEKQFVSTDPKDYYTRELVDAKSGRKLMNMNLDFGALQKTDNVTDGFYDILVQTESSLTLFQHHGDEYQRALCYVLTCPRFLNH